MRGRSSRVRPRPDPSPGGSASTRRQPSGPPASSRSSPPWSATCARSRRTSKPSAASSRKARRRPRAGSTGCARGSSELAPVLLALDVRVDGAIAPTEATRGCSHRVGVQLAETQVSTAGLIAALRRSDLDGPAVNALLRELERFGALGSALDFGPGATSFAPTPQPIDTAASAAVVPAPASGDSPGKPSVGRPRADDAPAPAAGQPAPAPWPSAPDSSAASPGGALSVAGLALLAALLIGLLLPRLLARLELAPGRGHCVASVLALERPG